MIGLNRTGLSLEEKFWAAKAHTKLAKEARDKVEEVQRSVKGAKESINFELTWARFELLATREGVLDVKKMMAIERVVTSELCGRVNKLARELDLSEEAMRVAEEKAKVAKRKIAAVLTQVVEDKAAAITEAKAQTIAKYKASIDFEANMAKGSIMAYSYCFKACQT